jgi:hypothetical protein
VGGDLSAPAQAPAKKTRRCAGRCAAQTQHTVNTHTLACIAVVRVHGTAVSQLAAQRARARCVAHTSKFLSGRRAVLTGAALGCKLARNTHLHTTA